MSPYDPFHVVKEAAASDAFRRFGVKGVNVAKKLFTPLAYKDQGPGMLRSGYNAWKNRSAPGTGAVIPEAAKGLWRSSKGFGRGAVEYARESTFGSPGAVANQLANNYRQTGSLGGMAKKQIKDFYLNPLDNLGWKAVSLGVPAMNLRSSFSEDPEHRGESIGGALTALATAPFTARLGYAGGLIQAPVQNLGRRVGRLFDRSPYPSNNSTALAGTGGLPHPV